MLFDMRDEFIEGVATALFADLWMNAVEELAEDYSGLYRDLYPGPGGAWLDVLPDLPKSAIANAKEYLKKLQAVNHATLRQIVSWAESDGDIDVNDLGFYFAMQSLGHGISWFDDHAKFDVELPDWEASPELYSDVWDMIEEEKENAG